MNKTTHWTFAVLAEVSSFCLFFPLRYSEPCSCILVHFHLMIMLMQWCLWCLWQNGFWFLCWDVSQLNCWKDLVSHWLPGFSFTLRAKQQGGNERDCKDLKRHFGSFVKKKITSFMWEQSHRNSFFNANVQSYCMHISFDDWKVPLWSDNSAFIVIRNECHFHFGVLTTVTQLVNSVILKTMIGFTSLSFLWILS